MLRALSISMLAGILWIGPSLASASSGDTPYMQYGPDYMQYGPDYMQYGPAYMQYGPAYMQYGADYMQYGADYMNYGPNFSNRTLNRGLGRCVNCNGYRQTLPYKR